MFGLVKASRLRQAEEKLRQSDKSLELARKDRDHYLNARDRLLKQRDEWVANHPIIRAGRDNWHALARKQVGGSSVAAGTVESQRPRNTHDASILGCVQC